MGIFTSSDGMSWIEWVDDLDELPTPDPVEQFNATRIAARARCYEQFAENMRLEHDMAMDELCAGEELAAAMSVPLPHDTDRHERLMPYRR